MPDQAVPLLMNALLTREAAGDLPQQLVRLVKSIEPGDLLPLVRQWARNGEHLESEDFPGRLMVVLPRLMALQLPEEARQGGFAELLDELYRQTPPGLPLACLWLMWMGLVGTEAADEIWSRALVERPPQSMGALSWAFQPFFSRPQLATSVTGRLLEQGLGDPVVAPAILDLFNFRARRKIDVPHAALDHGARLSGLLRSIVHQMHRIEEGNLPAGVTADEISRNVNHSVALSVALCDALGLCRFGEAEGPLRQALELKHRRIRTEAAGALARMDIQAGHEVLVQLAAEPVARLRVLAYADEMGLLDRIPADQQSARARAESRLAIWLAEPGQMGMAPTRMELIEQRQLSWPGYEDPQDCFLFRFHYGNQYSGQGISGPCVHAFAFDTDWMTPVELFAAFAGWQTEHESCFRVSPEEFRRREPGQARQLERELEDCAADETGIEASQPVLAGHLPGDWILLAEGTRAGARGMVAVDGRIPRWYPEPDQSPLDPEVIWLVELGRRLLDRFNPESGFG